jgi:hypothetical protein
LPFPVSTRGETMGCLGVHFSLSADEVERIRAVGESERVDYLSEVVEEEFFTHHRERLVESDKAWDAMHRALSGGHLTWGAGEYPLNHVILAGERLYEESDYIVVLKTPDKVRDVAAALPALSKDEFRRRYFAIPPDSYGFPLSDEDFEYTWGNFEDVRIFWLRAASEGRYVLFTADQ